MSLIKQPITSAPIPLTKEQLLAAKIRNIKTITARAYDQLIKIQNEGINAFWKDGRLTPQEIATAMGEDAVKAFQFHGFLTDCIVNIATADGIEPEIKLPTNAFEVVDGLIVVSEDPYVAQ
jgi:hypothetical protein